MVRFMKLGYLTYRPYVDTFRANAIYRFYMDNKTNSKDAHTSEVYHIRRPMAFSFAVVSCFISGICFLEGIIWRGYSFSTLHGGSFVAPFKQNVPNN